MLDLNLILKKDTKLFPVCHHACSIHSVMSVGLSRRQTDYGSKDHKERD